MSSHYIIAVQVFHNTLSNLGEKFLRHVILTTISCIKKACDLCNIKIYYILVDNASRDRTSEFLASLLGCKRIGGICIAHNSRKSITLLVRLQRNVGYAGAMYVAYNLVKLLENNEPTAAMLMNDDLLIYDYLLCAKLLLLLRKLESKVGSVQPLTYQFPVSHKIDSCGVKLTLTGLIGTHIKHGSTKPRAICVSYAEGLFLVFKPMSGLIESFKYLETFAEDMLVGLFNCAEGLYNIVVEFSGRSVLHIRGGTVSGRYIKARGRSSYLASRNKLAVILSLPFNIIAKAVITTSMMFQAILKALFIGSTDVISSIKDAFALAKLLRKTLPQGSNVSLLNYLVAKNTLTCLLEPNYLLYFIKELLAEMFKTVKMYGKVSIRKVQK